MQAFGRCGRIARLIFKGFKMDAFAQPRDRSATIGPRFDYLALAPAAAAFATLFYSGPFMPWLAHKPQRLRQSQLSARP